MSKKRSNNHPWRTQLDAYARLYDLPLTLRVIQFDLSATEERLLKEMAPKIMTHEERMRLINQPFTFELVNTRKYHALGTKKPTLSQMEQDGGLR